MLVSWLWLKAVTNFCFADDFNDVAREEEKLAKLVEGLNKAPVAYGMEVSAKKTKLMTNNTSSINKEIKVNGQNLEAVTSFMYLAQLYLMRVPSLSYSPG